MRRSGLVWLAAVWAASGAAEAQELRARGLGPTTGQLVARRRVEQSLGVRVDVRWDPATGAPALVRFVPPVALKARSPDDGAKELLRALEPLWGRLPLEADTARRGPHLVAAGTRSQGALRRLLFHQTLEAIPLDGGELLVTLGSRNGKCLGIEVSGRAYRDAPWGVVLPRGRSLADLVLSPRGGSWRLLRRRLVRGEHGLPVETLVDGEDVVARRRRWHAGSAEAELDGRRFPLADLEVGAGTRMLTTGPTGDFPGSAASLPFGLSGPFERVVGPAQRSWPGAPDGRLRLAFPPDDPRQAELAAFVHLQAARRFQRSSLRGLAPEEVELPLLARVEEGWRGAAWIPGPLEVDGRSFEGTILLGSDCAKDPTLVSHERAHVLVRQLGFEGDEGEAAAVLEGVCDYLAALEHRTPTIGGRAGRAARGLDEDRLYPRDLTANPHEAGRILAGALWDAHEALGGGGPGPLEEALLRALRRLGPATTLASAAEQLRHELPESSPALGALEKALRAHGLLPSRSGDPPALVVSTGPLSLQAGGQAEVWVAASDRDDPASDSRSSVELLVDGPEWVTRAGEQVEPGQPPIRRLRLLVTPPPGAETVAELSLVAQSRRSGRVSIRAVPIQVSLPRGTRDESQDEVLELRVVAGEVRREPLSAILPDVGPGARWSLAGWSQGASAIQARHVPACVAVVGPDLVVAAEAEEAGTHMFRVTAEPGGHSRRVQLVVLGAEEEGAIHAFHLVGGGAERTHELLLPGQPLLLERGAGARIAILGEGGDDLLMHRPSPRARAELRVAPAEPGSVERELGDEGGQRVRAELLLDPDPAQGADELEVTLVLVKGKAVARRTIRILVRPTGLPGGEEEAARARGDGMRGAVEEER